MRGLAAPIIDYGREPISRILSRHGLPPSRRIPEMTIHLAHWLPNGSSDLPECGVKRARWPLLTHLHSYLTLLRVRFALPSLLPALRCALTAPFHPYLREKACGRFVFCGTVCRIAPRGRYPPPCFRKSGLSSTPEDAAAIQLSARLWLSAIVHMFKQPFEALLTFQIPRARKVAWPKMPLKGDDELLRRGILRRVAIIGQLAKI